MFRQERHSLPRLKLLEMGEEGVIKGVLLDLLGLLVGMYMGGRISGSWISRWWWWIRRQTRWSEGDWDEDRISSVKHGGDIFKEGKAPVGGHVSIFKEVKK